MDCSYHRPFVPLTYFVVIVEFFVHMRFKCCYCCWVELYCKRIVKILSEAYGFVLYSPISACLCTWLASSRVESDRAKSMLRIVNGTNSLVIHVFNSINCLLLTRSLQLLPTRTRSVSLLEFARDFFHTRFGRCGPHPAALSLRRWVLIHEKRAFASVDEKNRASGNSNLWF